MFTQIIGRIHMMLAAAQIESNIHESRRKQDEAREQNKQNTERYLKVMKDVESNAKRGWTDCGRDGILDVSIDDRTQK